MERSASSRRSVLKMLYSVSSAVNELPVSGVPSVVPVVPSSNPWPLPELKACRRFLQQRAIGGEVLIHQQRAAQGNDRHQVGGRHLLVHIVLRRRDRVVDFVRLHGREIEEQNDQPPVFKGSWLGRSCCGRRSCVCLPPASGSGFAWAHPAAAPRRYFPDRRK